LCHLLWPYIETYWLVAISLFALFPNAIVEENEYLTNIQKLGQTLYYEGELGYFESVSKETVKTALNRFSERNVIVRKQVNAKTTVIKLSDTATSSPTSPPPITQTKMLTTIEKIGRFRRKGKYSQETEFSARLQRLTKMIVPNAKAKL